MNKSVDVLFSILLLVTVVLGLLFLFNLGIYFKERKQKAIELSSFAIPGSLFVITLLALILYVSK